MWRVVVNFEEDGECVYKTIDFDDYYLAIEWLNSYTPYRAYNMTTSIAITQITNN